MRTTCIATLLTGLTLLALAGTASAAPTLTLFWSGTSGSGTPGGSIIAASVGDTLTVDVIFTIHTTGGIGASWDMVGTPGFTAISNSLVPTLGGPPECPSPPNLVPGTCFSVTFKTFAPLMVGVVDAGSSTTGYDVVAFTPEFTPSSMTIGRGVFVLSGGSLPQSISTSSALVFDGGFNAIVPAISTVHILPEPTTAALLGLGLVAIAVTARRRAL